MNWTRTALALSNLLCLVLIVRLFALRLHHVYRVFAIFLVFEFVSSLVVVAERLFRNTAIDYRVTWLFLQAIGWVVWLWMVYALLRAILENLPGILRVSKRALSLILTVSLLLSVITVNLELSVSGAGVYQDPLDRTVRTALVVQRVISSVALLTLLLMLLFILWFPVRLPRNLATFSVGFVCYFCAKTVLLLVHLFWSRANFSLLDNGVAIVLGACYLYWLIVIDKQGESVPMVIGHRWRVDHQARLMGELESINAQLLRAARR